MRYFGFLAALVFIGQPATSGTLSLITMDLAVAIDENYFGKPDLNLGQNQAVGSSLSIASVNSSAQLDANSGAMRLKLTAADELRQSTAAAFARFLFQNSGDTAVVIPQGFFAVSGSATILRGGQVGAVVAGGGYRYTANTSPIELVVGGASKGCRAAGFLECFETVTDANVALLTDQATSGILAGPSARYAYSKVLGPDLSISPGSTLELNYSFNISLEQRRNQSVPADSAVDGTNTLRFSFVLPDGTALDVSRFPGLAPQWIRTVGAGGDTGGSDDVAVIPLPGSGILLLGALSAFAWSRRRATGPVA